jgi:hypothetical protein
MLAHIVTDEQRGNRPKAARRCAVALGSPLGASRRWPGGQRARGVRRSYPVGFPRRSRFAYLVESGS